MRTESADLDLGPAHRICRGWRQKEVLAELLSREGYAPTEGLVLIHRLMAAGYIMTISTPSETGHYLKDAPALCERRIIFRIVDHSPHAGSICAALRAGRAASRSSILDGLSPSIEAADLLADLGTPERLEVAAGLVGSGLRGSDLLDAVSAVLV